jgi:hypothetical protein
VDAAAGAAPVASAPATRPPPPRRRRRRTKRAVRWATSRAMSAAKVAHPPRRSRGRQRSAPLSGRASTSEVMARSPSRAAFALFPPSARGEAGEPAAPVCWLALCSFRDWGESEKPRQRWGWGRKRKIEAGEVGEVMGAVR